MSDLTRFGVSLEQDLLDSFDGYCRKHGYANRSEALRHCIRQVLAAEEVSRPDAQVTGVLSLVYDHHDSDLPRRLTAMQHEAHDFVLATLHIHLDIHHCLEVMTLRGAGGQVLDLANRLRAARGVLQSSLSLTGLESNKENHHHD